MCAAPLALASSLQAELVARGAVGAERRAGAKAAAGVNVAAAGAANGNSITVQEAGAVSSTEVIIIWVNQGAGAATQTINSAASTISSTAVAAATHSVRTESLHVLN